MFFKSEKCLTYVLSNTTCSSKVSFALRRYIAVDSDISPQ